MNKTIEEWSKSCEFFQKNIIISNKKYGKILLTEDWDKFELCERIRVNVIGPRDIKYKLTKNGNSVTVQLLALAISIEQPRGQSL